MIVYAVVVYTYYSISLFGVYDSEEEAEDNVKQLLKSYKKCVVKIMALDVFKPISSKTYKMEDGRLVIV